MFQYPAPEGHAHGSHGYAVLDVETSGFDATGGSRILEVAIVRIDAAGRELGVFETLVDPGTSETGAREVHGIDADMLVDAPTFPEIAPTVLAWLDGVVVVAHNAPFEDGFLTAELSRAGLLVPDVPALDTLPLAQQVLTLPNYRLATVCDWAGVRIDGAHTAAGDARATAAVLPHLLRRAGAPQWAVPLRPLGGWVAPGYLPRSRVKAALPA